MVGVMFQPGDKVIFNGGHGVLVPVGSKGIIITKDNRFIDESGGNLYDVRFDAANGLNQVRQICEAKFLSYYLLINDKIKIVGPISGTDDDEYLGFEGTVIYVHPLKIQLQLSSGAFRELYVRTSSIEKLEPIIGSKWWV